MSRPQNPGAIRGLFDGAESRQANKPESLPQYRVACTDFRSLNRNTLQGFATLVVDPPRIAIRDCAVHEKNGKRWVNFPAKPYTGEDGVARWQSLITIEGKAEYWHFQNLATAAIDRYLVGAERST